MLSAKSPERRVGRRNPVRWQATWRVYDETGPAVLDEGELCDVSAGGAFLRPYSWAAHPLFAGTKVTIEFPAPGHVGPMQASGIVRWTGLHRAHGCGGVGIEFEDSSRYLDDFAARK